MAGCCGAILLALVIPKQYVSAAKLVSPEAQSASKLALQKLTGGFGSIAGGLLGGTSGGALVVAMMRSRTVEDRIIDRFNLKKVYRIALQQEVRARLEVKTAISLEPKSGIVVLSVTDSDPQRAAGMAHAYVQELEVLMAQLNISSAHRERVFLQDQLQVVKVAMETAEKELAAGTGSAIILSGVWILGVARWRETDPRHPGMVLAREIFWKCAIANCLGADEAR